jgi:sialidase-1
MPSKIYRRTILQGGILLASRSVSAATPSAPVAVYRAGSDGYFSYRIPALLRTPKGTLLAFAEARKNSRSDSGDIDMVVKRSSDGGMTWSAQKLIVDQGPDTIGNPCPLVERRSGAILLPLTANPGSSDKRDLIASKGTRTVWITESRDDGRTWSPPREISREVKKPDWTWYATGPGVGIQLVDGRIVIPCNHRVSGSDTSYSHAMFSDDGGKSWTSGRAVAEKTNECQVVELANGHLLMNMRSFHGDNRRVVARSRDRGLTWEDSRLDGNLIEPACQGSLIRAGDALLFSNPAAATRVNMTVRISRDEGRSWSGGQSLHAGPSAYSCLAALGAGQAACLFECGDKSAYDEIRFLRFPVDWIAAGRS